MWSFVVVCGSFSLQMQGEGIKCVQKYSKIVCVSLGGVRDGRVRRGGDGGGG